MSKTHLVGIRLGNEEIDEINAVRGVKSLSAYCKDVIINHHVVHPVDVLTGVNIEALQIEIKHKNELLDSVNKNIADLQNMNGYLIQENTRLNLINDKFLLTDGSKKWWHFWKKGV